jgi:hypothetical protein
MGSNDYREAYAAKLAQRSGTKSQDALSFLTEQQPETAPEARESLVREQPKRFSAGAALQGGAASDPIHDKIKKLTDTTAPPAVRQEALETLQAATFLGPKFDPYRPAYRDALRKVATDPDQDLRQQALEILAINKDEYARDLLLDSVNGKREALVSTAKAVQLLGYDDHGAGLSVAHAILDKGNDLEAQEEAVRVLASDPKSEQRLLDLLKNSSAATQLRTASAMALHALNPQRFEQEARKIVADDEEDSSLRASSLGALTTSQRYAATRNDPSFADQVSKLQSSDTAEHLRASATRFMQKRDGK